MNTVELRDFLYQEIPLAKAMGVEVVSSDAQRTELMAPLPLNRNHLETAFGGSLNSLLILSCYGWLFHKLHSDGFSVHVLIQAGNTDYLLPVEKDIHAICSGPLDDDFQKFFSAFKRKGIARLKLKSQVIIDSGVACRFEGEFVARKVSV